MTPGVCGDGNLPRSVAIDVLQIGLDVLGIPVVVEITTGIETYDKGFEIVWQYEPAVAGTAISVELLAIDPAGVSRATTPWVVNWTTISIGEFAILSERESVVLRNVIRRARIVGKTYQVAR